MRVAVGWDEANPDPQPTHAACFTFGLDALKQGKNILTLALNFVRGRKNASMSLRPLGLRPLHPLPLPGPVLRAGPGRPADPE